MTIVFLFVFVLAAVVIGWFYGKPPTGPTGTTNGAPGSPGCGRPGCKLCAVLSDIAWTKTRRAPLWAPVFAVLFAACGGAVSTDPSPPYDEQPFTVSTCHAPTGPTSIVTTCAVEPECTTTNRVDPSGCFLTHDEVCRYNEGSVSSRIIVPLTWSGSGWYGYTYQGCLYVAVPQ